MLFSISSAVDGVRVWHTTVVTMAQAGVPDDATLIQQINATFQLFDKAKNGSCDERDVATIIQALGLNPTVEIADTLLEEMRDPDTPSQFIQRQRFESVMLRVMKFQNDKAAEIPKDSEEKILRAFQALDKDNKGYLEPDELREFMTVKARNPFSAEEFENMLNAAQDPETQSVFYEDYAEVLAGKVGPGRR